MKIIYILKILANQGVDYSTALKNIPLSLGKSTLIRHFWGLLGKNTDNIIKSKYHTIILSVYFVVSYIHSFVGINIQSNYTVNMNDYGKSKPI